METRGCTGKGMPGKASIALHSLCGPGVVEDPCRVGHFVLCAEGFELIASKGRTTVSFICWERPRRLIYFVVIFGWESFEMLNTHKANKGAVISYVRTEGYTALPRPYILLAFLYIAV